MSNNSEKSDKYTADDYFSFPEEMKVELINGMIYDMSPSPLRIHQEISGGMFAEIYNYIKKNKGGCKVYSAPFDVKLSDDTVVIPDISVICDANKLTDKGCTGAPDWIIEIVSGNASHDYITKLVAYKTYGVKEYWIVDPKKQIVTVYILENDCDMTVYKFSDTIPVNIYDGNFQINISKLI